MLWWFESGKRFKKVTIQFEVSHSSVRKTVSKWRTVVTTNTSVWPFRQVNPESRLQDAKKSLQSGSCYRLFLRCARRRSLLFKENMKARLNRVRTLKFNYLNIRTDNILITPSRTITFYKLWSKVLEEPRMKLLCWSSSNPAQHPKIHHNCVSECIWGWKIWIEPEPERKVRLYQEIHRRLAKN